METKAWQAQRRLYELLSGVKKGAVGDRAEYCTGIVESTLGFAAGRYFANETFGGESREKGTKVITDIIDSFKTSLRDIDWMDKKSAKAASEKVIVLLSSLTTLVDLQILIGGCYSCQSRLPSIPRYPRPRIFGAVLCLSHNRRG